ncbi:PREDICTED: CDT1-like protein a, chloroplastic [Populus euphratica]|uniref:CDT1-like protein a, chloroplastic n=1 Tax=Populus euphratica TaxID=75702 RepID=A0AAJ6XRN6_POPEU|nr:PREDICTED: CDT1-like protein a, chloroplastic [Populus euphratica]
MNSSSLHSPIPSSKSKRPQPDSESTAATPKSKPSSNPTIATQTPTQSSQLPPRLRKRRVALSLKEVRRIASQDLGTNQTKSARRQIASWPEDSTTTPSKPHKPRKNQTRNGLTKIPDKYEMLGEFFDNLDSSIRLLRMKGSMSTLSNISPKIESLTDRRFTHKHLAQLKYIMPEAIEIKRVLRFNEQTSCMKPELLVTVNADAIECDDGKLKSESKNMYLRKVFRSRLADFYRDHPQGDDIPEEMLPEPFNRLSLLKETSAVEEEQPIVASLLPQSFQRRFSQKGTKIEAENALQKLVSSAFEPCPYKISLNEEISCSAPSPAKVSLKPTRDQNFSSAIPSKEKDSMNEVDDSPIKIASVRSTPAKLASTPATLISTKPALHPHKRCMSSCDDDSFSSPDKLVRRPPSRSLIFETPVKHAKDEQKEPGDLSDDDSILKILPESLLQSIREKEQKAKEERDPAISQAKRRRQMIACLPKLFNKIHFLFQSIKQSVLTKEELIHKIIASHFDIADRREVEEQLNLLLELVPEWISEKLASSGDLLFRINKLYSPETVRAQLEEAN